MVGRTTGKRVRTGCMTCRGRRRKCDEQKPECANCLSKGLNCRYDSKLTFVESKFQDWHGKARAEPVSNAVQFHQPSPRSHTKSASPDQRVAGIGRSAASLAKKSTGYWDSRAVETYPVQTPASDTRSARRRIYELDLVSYYRYHLAPVLDLGLGSLFFGVGVLIESKRNEATHHAVVAAASSQRALTLSDHSEMDQATSVTSAHLARDGYGSHHAKAATSEILLLWRDIYLLPVEGWSAMSPRILEHASGGATVLEEWLVLSRLHCAAALTSFTPSTNIGSFPARPQITSDHKLHPAVSQLRESLWILERTFVVLSTSGHLLNNLGNSLAHDWHARWQELQQWYLARNGEMQPILEVTVGEIQQLQQQDTIEFPHIVFSNACAIVANIVHHVTSLMLLQSKPRLIKPTARSNSSVSSLWHTHRAIGIALAATEAEIWDPFITAALLFCSRNLSNGKQILSVAEKLQQIQRLSGLKLQRLISELEELAQTT